LGIAERTGFMKTRFKVNQSGNSDPRLKGGEEVKIIHLIVRSISEEAASHKRRALGGSGFSLTGFTL